MKRPLERTRFGCVFHAKTLVSDTLLDGQTDGLVLPFPHGRGSGRGGVVPGGNSGIPGFRGGKRDFDRIPGKRVFGPERSGWGEFGEIDRILEIGVPGPIRGWGTFRGPNGMCQPGQEFP